MSTEYKLLEHVVSRFIKEEDIEAIVKALELDLMMNRIFEKFVLSNLEFVMIFDVSLK